ncbi:MAG TPA: RNA polymerase subunit sigma-70, partial [Streptosporangiaceae bacterium]
MTGAQDAAEDVLASFGDLSERYRRELHLHCYRMLGSFDDAEDAVQEALLRAWRARDSFDGGTLFRAWLYRITTNVCLDVLRRRARHPAAIGSMADLPWLQPYPDRLLDEIPAPAERPDEVVVARETVSLAFIAALQVLPARQRAALISRDVLGWSAARTAGLLQTSVAAANSALQRARSTMAGQLPPDRADWPSGQPDPRERALLERFIDAHERGDTDAAAAIAASDITITMPPNPMWFRGLSGLLQLLDRAFGPDREGDWKLLPTAANRMPAAASYLRRPGDTAYRAFKLDVLRIRDGEIAEITTFGYALFGQFGLPATV